MWKKYLSAALVVWLLNLAFYSSAAANTDKDAKYAEKVRASIIKLGADENSKIEIRLKDGTKVKGYVSEIKESGFVLILAGTSEFKEVQYSQVKQVKGQNSSNGRKIFVRASIIIGALLLYGYLFSRSSDF